MLVLRLDAVVWNIGLKNECIKEHSHLTGKIELFIKGKKKSREIHLCTMVECLMKWINGWWNFKSPHAVGKYEENIDSGNA